MILFCVEMVLKPTVLTIPRWTIYGDRAKYAGNLLGMAVGGHRCPGDEGDRRGNETFHFYETFYFLERTYFVAITTGCSFHTTIDKHTSLISQCAGR